MKKTFLVLNLIALVITASAQNKKSVVPDAVLSAKEQKYARQLIFSSEPISTADFDETKIKTSFTLGEPIYARLILSNAMANVKDLDKRDYASIKNDVPRCYVVVTIDGDETGKEDISRVELNDMTFSSYSGTIVLMDKKEKVPAGKKAINDYLLRKLPTLAGGPHKVTIAVDVATATSRKNVAESEFTVIVGDAPVQAAHSWAEYRNTGDQDVIKDMTALAKRTWPADNIQDTKCAPWSIEKDGNDYPVARVASVSVYIIKGKRCVARTFFYRQQYAGAGTYSSGGRLDADFAGHVNFQDDLVNCK